MDQTEKAKKRRFLKAQFAVVICIFYVWFVMSATVDIDDVKAGILKQVVKIDPDNVKANLFLGDYYAELYHYEEAIQGLREAIKTNPNDVAKYSELGALYNYLNYNEEAIKSYQQAIHIEPNTAETHYNLAKVYLEIGNKDLAFREYEILKSLDEELAKELHDFIE